MKLFLALSLLLLSANFSHACKNASMDEISGATAEIDAAKGKIFFPNLAKVDDKPVVASLSIDEFRNTIVSIDPSINVLEVLQKVQAGQLTLTVFTCNFLNPDEIQYTLKTIKTK